MSSEEQPLLDTDEVATLLGTTPRTLRSWIARGLDIPLIRIHDRVLRFHEGDFHAWVDARRRRAREAFEGRTAPNA